MIYNSTYTDIEKDIETDKLVGKKYNLIKSIRMGGIAVSYTHLRAHETQ